MMSYGPEIFRFPEYLSPSSIQQWENCPYQFYLQRMSNIPYVERQGTLATQVGTLFDKYFKEHLSKVLGLPIEWDERTKNEKFTEHEILMAKDAWDTYRYGGALKDLIDEGVAHIFLDKKCTLPIGPEGGIPIFGMPDLQMQDGRIIDVKTRGAMRGTSPTPGYYRHYDCFNRTRKVHDRAGDPLEKLHTGWATQLTIYSWQHQGMPDKFRRIPVGIEEVYFAPSREIYVTKIRTDIGVDFQETLKNKIVNLWTDILDKNIPLPQANKFKCHKYGKRCDYADYCPSYQEALDPSNPAVSPEDWARQS
jgi:hypothetical protein